MCVSQKRYFTKSHILSLDNFSPGYFTVGCGQCSECLEKYKQDYFIRTYFEAFDCIKKGGFCLFDTLTYRPDKRPKISHFIDNVSEDLDFDCFSKRDVQLFLKRLRKKLPSDSVRYFIASEYGGSSEYVDDHGRLRKAQNAPHYHVIFFVTAPVHPYKFSCMVADSWQLGRTDGAPFKGYQYVKEKRLFRCSPSNYHFGNVINYVQKYLLKDSEFQKEIDRRLFLLVNSDNSQWRYRNLDFFKAGLLTIDQISSRKVFLDSSFDRDLYNKYRRLVSQFHLSSQGFGVQALHDPQVVAHINKYGFLRIENNGDNKRFSLPMYYYRKLYYETYVNQYGKKAWRLSEFGVDHVFQNLENRIRAKRFKITAAALDAQLTLSPELVDELAKYLVVYRGTISRNLFRSDYRFDFLSRYFVSPNGNIVYNHNTFSSVKQFGFRFVSDNDLGVADAWSSVPVLHPVPPNTFGVLACYYDDSLELLIEKLDLACSYRSQKKENVYFLKKKLCDMV